MIFYLGLLTVTALAAALFLLLKGINRRFAVACHPNGRHGLAYKPERAVTHGMKAAELGFRAIEPAPAPLQWKVTGQVIQR